jgi:hypothetical protein
MLILIIILILVLGGGGGYYGHSPLGVWRWCWHWARNHSVDPTHCLPPGWSSLSEDHSIAPHAGTRHKNNF